MEGARIDYPTFDAEETYRSSGCIIGSGRVGGKSKGLAYARNAILGSPIEDEISFPDLTIVVSTEIFDSYINDRCLGWMYDDEDWEKVSRTIMETPLTDSVMADLDHVLDRFDALGAPPLAVRSSSLLEDSVSLAFAGKYHTGFMPNCVGSRSDRLALLSERVREVYASLFNPSARAYREKHGRAHRDESMAVIIQSLSGRDHGGMFYPELAGTIFSRVFRRPSPRIKKEDGLMRVCFGLGTRTVDRCAARTFYLTNPSLRPEGSMPAQVVASSQENFDYIDRERGEFTTGSIGTFTDKIRREHKNFGAYVEFYADNFLYSALAEPEGPSRPLFSFPELHTRERTLFARAKSLMAFMEQTSGIPMDMEFTYESKPSPEFRLVQMRPLASYEEMKGVHLPSVPDERVLFRGNKMVTNGAAEGATHLVYVDPYKYKGEWSPGEAARAVGEVNKMLAGKKYILAGPGRWGSRNPALGVPIMYAEICNACCLIEISVPELNFSPELSFGTHFFLDMDADGILYLPVFSGQSGNTFNLDWLNSAPYKVGGHPSVRIYEGSFSVYLDGESEQGMTVIG